MPITVDVDCPKCDGALTIQVGVRVDHVEKLETSLQVTLDGFITDEGHQIIAEHVAGHAAS